MKKIVPQIHSNATKYQTNQNKQIFNYILHFSDLAPYYLIA